MELRPRLAGLLEAMLLISDEPVTSARVARVIDEPAREIEETLEGLAAEYEESERGFQLRKVAGGWRMYTHPAHHEAVEKLVLSWDTRRLSQAALEALAVVAYHQPVTRAGVNAVRGVNSEGVIASLVEKGLVKEVGRDTEQGNAVLFGTTRAFMERFGLDDLSDLPPLEQFGPDPDTEDAIRRRLSAMDIPLAAVSGDAACADSEEEDDGDVPTID